jgi:phage gpG-like protein
MPFMPREPKFNTPLRLSDIKVAIYRGLRFDRVLYAGWMLNPSIGLVAKDIERLGIDIRSFRVPLSRAVSEVMTRSIRRNFDVGGRPDPWAPLADYTVEVRGTSEPILVRSGRLRRIASQFNIWTITQTSASIRSLPESIWYGNIHQAGYGSLMDIARKELGAQATLRDIKVRALQLMMGARPPGRQTKFVIPQRQFILFQEVDIEAIQEIFINWMEDRADRVGRSWNRIV